VKIEWYSQAKAVYIYLTDEKIQISKEISNDLVVNLDARGEPVGIAILSVKDAPIVFDFTVQP